MGKKLQLYFSLFISAIVSSTYIFKEESMVLLLDALQRQTQILPQQSMYPLLDRMHLAQGEAIWLRAYIVNLERNWLTTIKKKLTLIKNEKANGRFIIADRFVPVVQLTNGNILKA